jgi:hypothetical protein
VARRKTELFGEIVVCGLRGHDFVNERSDLAGVVRGDGHTLLGWSAPTDDAKNSFARNRKADRASGHASRHHRQLVIGPHSALATEATSHKRRDQLDVVLF